MTKRWGGAPGLIKNLWFWLGLALVGVVLFAAFGRSGRTVEVVTPQRQEVVQQVVGVGRIAPASRVQMGALALGMVRAVHVQEGQKVQPGMVLVEIEDAEAQAAVKAAQASVEQARAKLNQLSQVGAKVARETAREAELRLKEAESNLERERSLLAARASTTETVERLANQAASARSRYDAAMAQLASTMGDGADVRQALAAVSQAEASLASARARLAQLRLVAPGEGIILSRSVEPGDVVQPGKTLLVFASSGNPVVTAEIEEKNLALLRLGQSAGVIADAYPQTPFPARLTQISSQVNATRGTVEVKFAVENPPEFLRADMSVSVSLEVGRTTDALVLPSGAVRDLGTSKPWVLVFDGSEVEKRDVALGIRGERMVEVRSGIVAGERVVATATGIEPGSRVRVVERR